MSLNISFVTWNKKFLSTDIEIIIDITIMIFINFASYKILNNQIDQFMMWQKLINTSGFLLLIRMEIKL